MIWTLWLNIFSIWGTKKDRIMSYNTLNKTLCDIKFKIYSEATRLRNIWMGESMISYQMSFIIHSLENIRVHFCIFSNYKKCCRYLLLFQNIKNLWCIRRIWTVIKSQTYYLSTPCSITSNLIWKWAFCY